MITLPITVDLYIEDNLTVCDLIVENKEEVELDIDIKTVAPPVEEYEGDYTVSATTSGDVILETAGKYLTEDITVSKLKKQTDQRVSFSLNADTGEVTSSATYSDGYNDNIKVVNHTTRLQTMGARTVYPRPMEQVAVGKGFFTTGIVKVAAVPTYDGGLSITPTDQEQVIEIQGKMASQNIVVEPIPSNYGRIIWDGSHLSIK